MASKKNRARAHRRERRKGRASDFRREPKADMSKHGHGGNGSKTTVIETRVARNKDSAAPIVGKKPLTWKPFEKLGEKGWDEEED